MIVKYTRNDSYFQDYDTDIAFWSSDDELSKAALQLKNLKFPSGCKNGDSFVLQSFDEVEEKTHFSVCVCVSEDYTNDAFFKIGQQLVQYKKAVIDIGNLSAQQISDITTGLIYGGFDIKPSAEPDERKFLLFSADESVKDAIKIGRILGEEINLARKITNLSGDSATHFDFLNNVKDNPKLVACTIYDLDNSKAGLIKAVARGSECPPEIVRIEYRGKDYNSSPIVLIGKGILFDTGGLNLKTGGYMKNMFDDKAGAATVLATMNAIARLKLKVNVVAYLPICENSIGPNAIRPGDIVKSHSGKTVEINNTDAEGRLILADTISIAIEEELKPQCIIDVATLTGSIVGTFGSHCAGLFSNDNTLAKSLLQSGVNVGEKLWRLPLLSEFSSGLDSKFADMRNCDDGGSGGAISAALFLEKFVDNVPWAHLDIAGTAFISSATGFGVLTLVEFLKAQE
jgi:leucyl aminopeptidase